MKRVQYDRYGGAEVMRLETFVPEEPQRDEVAIAVQFAAINPIDWKARSGAMKMVTGKSFPRAMGLDLSGTVTAVGSGVTRFAVGDEVFGMTRFKECGALAQSAIAKESALALKPPGVSFQEAACLATPGVTAWNALVDKAKITAHSTVFINGCAGAVGESAVQIAQLLGAQVAGSCAKDSIDRALSLGMTKVYDYKATDPATLADTFDVVFDAAGTLSTSEGLRMLRKGGRFATVEPTLARLLRAVFDRRLKPIIGTPRAELLDSLAKAAEEKKFQLPIAVTVPLQQAIPLIKDIEHGRRLRGKAVVSMN
jgi:NADPH:quinone reductase-like Zn-dependent oxidoreductase